MTQVDPSPIDLPGPAEPLRQALVIHPDGTAGFTFVSRPGGEAISATHRGATWVAWPIEGPQAENPSATSFARSVGWHGAGMLCGTFVFVGGDIEDVPGVLMAEALRLWGELPVN